jgi:hypothetical protein
MAAEDAVAAGGAQIRRQTPQPGSSTRTLQRALFMNTTVHRRRLDREGIFRTVENRDVFDAAAQGWVYGDPENTFPIEASTTTSASFMYGEPQASTRGA